MMISAFNCVTEDDDHSVVEKIAREKPCFLLCKNVSVTRLLL